MSARTLAEAGTYYVAAVPDYTKEPPVTITTTGPDGTVVAMTYWSSNPAELPGLPIDGRATVGVIEDVPAGSVVSTDHSDAWLVIRRPDQTYPVYDSATPGGFPPERDAPGGDDGHQ